MNLSDLRDLARIRLRDTSTPPLWSDDEIDANLNEAEREACVRALLIEDWTSDVTQIYVTTAEKEYEISDLLIDIRWIEANDNPGIKLSGWTLTEGLLAFDCFPSKDETITLRCYRLPAKKMEDDDDKPEIRAMHHDRMIDWALSLCYLTPDADGFDQAASDRYAARFTQSFGERFSALTQKNQRSKALRTVSCNGYI